MRKRLRKKRLLLSKISAISADHAAHLSSGGRERKLTAMKEGAGGDGLDGKSGSREERGVSLSLVVVVVVGPKKRHGGTHLLLLTTRERKRRFPD